MGHPRESGIDPPQTLDISHWDKYWLKWLKRLADAFPKVETYSETLTPVSVAANTTAEQTFTVNGLQTSDILTVNKPSLDAGIGIVNVRVTSINTMAITYSNNTGGAIVPTCLHLEDMEYKHWFAPELYGREITMPANIALTTMIHASEHIAILSKGSMTIYSEDGVKRVEAPCTMITKIGTKRAIYTHSEVVFTTIHANPENEKDINKLVDKMTFKTEQAFLDYALLLEDKG
jgi:hypothetical protein